MRTEKFSIKGCGEDNDDIQFAFQENGLADELGMIDVIVAEVCGENDEYSWYWILQMRDGTFAWAEGACDYTGWDCRSHAQFHGGFSSPFLALEALETSEHEPRKGIKACLHGQLTGTIPFACFQ